MISIGNQYSIRANYQILKGRAHFKQANACKQTYETG